MIKEGGWDIAIKTAVLPTAVTSEQLQCRQAGRRLFFPQPKNGSSLPNRRRSAFDFFPFPPPLSKIPFLGRGRRRAQKTLLFSFPNRSFMSPTGGGGDRGERGRERERARERRSPRAMGKREGEAAAVDMLQKNSESSALIPSPPFFFPLDPSKSFHKRSPSLHLIILLLRRCRAKRENPHRLSRSHRVRWYKRVTPNSRD